MRGGGSEKLFFFFSNPSPLMMMLRGKRIKRNFHNAKQNLRFAPPQRENERITFNKNGKSLFNFQKWILPARFKEREWANLLTSAKHFAVVAFGLGKTWAPPQFRKDVIKAPQTEVSHHLRARACLARFTTIAREWKCFCWIIIQMVTTNPKSARKWIRLSSEVFVIEEINELKEENTKMFIFLIIKEIAVLCIKVSTLTTAVLAIRWLNLNSTVHLEKTGKKKRNYFNHPKKPQNECFM